MRNDKKFGLSRAVILEVGVIFSAAVSVIGSVAINRASNSVFISILIAMSLALLGAVCFSELANFVGKEGDLYEYTRETLSTSAGFATGWLWLFSMLVLASVAAMNIAVSVASLLSASLPAFYNAVAALPILLLFAFLINTRFRFSTRFLVAMVLINLFIILLGVAVGMRFIGTTNYSLSATGISIGNTLFGAAVIFLVLSGFVRITEQRNDLVDPVRTVPRSAYLSIYVLLVCYVVLAILTIAILTHTKGTTSGLFSIEAYLTQTPLLLYVVSGAEIAALFGFGMMSLTGAARVFYAMSANFELPDVLKRTNAAGKPTNAIVLSAIACVILVFLAPFQTLIDSASGGMLMAFAVAAVAVVGVMFNERNAKHPRTLLFRKKYMIIVPIVSGLGNMAALFSISPLALGITFGVLVVSGLYYNYGRIFLLPKALLKKEVKSPKTNAIRWFSSS